MDLVKELELEDELLSQPMARHDRYVWYNRRLHRVPTGLAAMATTGLLSPMEKLRMAYGLVKSMPDLSGDSSLGAFFRFCLGDAAVDRLLKPFVAGVYAADPDQLSFEATFPRLYHPVRNQRRLISAVKAMAAAAPSTGPRSLVSFRSGMEVFPERLAAKLKAAGVTLLTGVHPTDLSVVPGDGYKVRLVSGDSMTADAVVLATPAPSAAELVKTVNPEASKTLRGISQTSLNVVHVGVPEEAVKNHDSGFGFLTTEDSKVRMLGSIWSDRIFPGRAPSGYRLFTCFYGGQRDPDALEWDNEHLLKQVRHDLSATMGLAADTQFSLANVTRWHPALPLFEIGHSQTMRQLRETLPSGLELLGNYVDGVSIPDRVDAGNSCAARLMDKLLVKI